MTGLVLKLGPKERILINGAVIENGDRRTRLTVLNSKANILRLKDAIHPNDANTPVKRACFTAQVILSGDADQNVAKGRLEGQISDLEEVLICEEAQSNLSQARRALDNGNVYLCLKALRQLLPLETSLLRQGIR